MALAELLAQGVPEGPPCPLTVGELTVSLATSLRWLPERRLTALANWNGTPVVAKVFAAGERGGKAFRRERRALDELRRRGVAAPACLASAETDNGALLLLEYLDGDTAARRLAALPDRAARRALITDLAGWVAAQHRRGVRQTDIHLDNFLAHEGQWYLLDADACRFGTVRHGAALDNLAWLLAQFAPLDVPDRDALRGVLPAVPGEARLRRVRARRYRRMLGKTQRECSEFVPVRAGALRGMARRDAWPALAALLGAGADGGDGLDRAMAEAAMLKDGGSATVVALAGNGWVIKRYNVKNRWHGLKRQVGRTRAKNAWLAGHFLQFIGISTPRPIAYLEERGGCWVGRCWLVCAEASGEGLDRWPAERPLPPRYRRPLLDLFTLMKKFRFAHGDMKASNVLLTGEGVSVIDLDACRRYRGARRAAAALRRDQARLLRNWPERSPLHRDLRKGLERE